MNKFKIFVSPLIILALAHLVYADTVILTDGRKLSGKFIKGDEKKIVFIFEGITMDLPRNLVSPISFGEKEALVDTGIKSTSKGKIKGVITYYFNRYQGYKPDLGASVYACKTKVDMTKLEKLNYLPNIINEKEIDDFIRTFCMYHMAKLCRELMALDPSRTEKMQENLKELGADTKEGWEKLQDQGWKVFFDLDYNRIPSEKARVGGDGTFSIELPPGNYFVIIRSKNRYSQDSWKAVKIAGGETVDISQEFR